MKRHSGFGGIAAGLIAVVLSVGIGGCKQTAELSDATFTAAPTAPNASAEALFAHSREFEKAVIAVADNVHVAVGYGLANSIMIEGDDGLIIVDTLESTENAKAVLAEFRKISHKPIKAIILTHNHADHIFGASVFAEGNTDIPVYAHASTNTHIDNVINVIRPAIYNRSMRMFGNYLDEHQRPNDGIGASLAMGDLKKVGLLRPTETLSDRRTLTIAGVRLELMHAPGETDDQLMVWLPDQKVLLPADNFYKAFPNLYTIRGTGYRDVLSWVRSLDRMRRLPAEYLVPSHGRPLSGAETIQTRLTNYRDAIQYVHDQTVRGINRGLTPDQLARTVHLPSHLAEDPYLQEFYGKVAFSVRNIFNGYLGWYSGAGEDLMPLSPAARAERWEQALTEGKSLVMLAQQALDNSDHQWALELAALVLATDPADSVAIAIKAEALMALGEAEANSTARNYLMTLALEARGQVLPQQPPSKDMPLEVVLSFPIDSVMNAMPVKLKAEECLELTLSVGFEFSDLNRHFTVTVRRGVAEVTEGMVGEPAARVRVSANDWKQIVSGHRNLLAAYAGRDLQVGGSIGDLVRFLSLFERG